MFWEEEDSVTIVPRISVGRYEAGVTTEIKTKQGKYTGSLVNISHIPTQVPRNK